MSSEALEGRMNALLKRAMGAEAEVARLEQERDAEAELFNGAQAALAVARERAEKAERAEQSLKAMLAATVERAEKAERERDEQEGYPGIAHDFLTAQSDRAVLLKALAAYEDGSGLAGQPPVRHASAAADEPEQKPHGWRAWFFDEDDRAAADEPGETPT